ncbi:hypothetical protein D3C81_2113230 [compost metagenome]
MQHWQVFDGFAHDRQHQLGAHGQSRLEHALGQLQRQFHHVVGDQFVCLVHGRAEVDGDGLQMRQFHARRRLALRI